MPLRDTADENNFCVFLLVLSNKPAALSFGLFGEQALHLCLCRPACRATAQARVSVGHVPRTCRMFLVPTLQRGNAYLLFQPLTSPSPARLASESVAGRPLSPPDRGRGNLTCYEYIKKEKT